MHKLAYTMRYLKHYFNDRELTTVLKNKLYSGIYYNGEVWLIPSLHSSLKRRLLSASAGIIRNAFGAVGWPISNRDMAGLPTPDKWANYCTARSLHGILNNESPASIYTGLACQALHKTRTGITYFSNTNRRRVGANAIQNRCKFVSKRLGHVNWLQEWNFLKNIVKKELLWDTQSIHKKWAVLVRGIFHKFKPKAGP